MQVLRGSNILEGSHMLCPCVCPYFWKVSLDESSRKTRIVNRELAATCCVWVFYHCPNVLEVSLLSCFPLMPVTWLVIHSFQGICSAMSSCCVTASPVCCYRMCCAFGAVPDSFLLVVPIFSAFVFVCYSNVSEQERKNAPPFCVCKGYWVFSSAFRL